MSSEETAPTASADANETTGDIAEQETGSGADVDAHTDDGSDASVDPVAAAEKERDDYLDALRRLQADFENYKKRMAKQQGEFVTRAAEDLVTKLLPVLDTMELALAHDPSGPLEQVATSLREVLQRDGLERVDVTAVPFDPTIHDAVMHEPGDGEPEVIEILRSGYKWKGRVLRPAMAKVKGS